MAAKYNPKTDLKQRPANSKDTGPGVWLLGRPKKQDKMTCKVCNKRIAGGIKRSKKHLAGGYGDVLLCSKVSTELRKMMGEYLDANNNAEEDGEQDEDEDEFDD